MMMTTDAIFINRVARTIATMVAAFVLSAVMTGCGDDSQFRIEGLVEGLGTRPVKITYVGDGSLRQEQTVAIDGKFSLLGASKDYTIVEVTATSRKAIGYLIVKNGQHLKCLLDVDNLYAGEVTGNKPSEQLADFIRENADSLADQTTANSIIARYVEHNKKSMVSTALMLTQFCSRNNELLADSLMEIISPDARPEKMVGDWRRIMSTINASSLNASMKSFVLPTPDDSIARFYPSHSTASLFYFSGDANARRDTILPRLKALHDSFNSRQLKLVEVSFHPDTTRWKLTVRADSVDWVQVWSPGGASNSAFDELQIPHLPYFIACDSTGRVILRSPSVKEATKETDSFISKRWNLKNRH